MNVHENGRTLGGRYAIRRKIGAGGMADVYEVEHLELGSSFAAKVMRKGSCDQRAVRRFLREARLLAGLRSEHIVTVFDVSSPRDEHVFYVMELLHGCDLRKLMYETPLLSLGRAVKIVLDACAGLRVAHAAALVHRDMKPENLFVTYRDDGRELCKILDFGVVKANAGTSTRHGALIGTLRYMAPEQIEHPASVSARADVYALGAVLYECLARRPPHTSESIERLLFQILNQPVAPIGSCRNDVPDELDRVVLRALDKDPLQRFATVEALAEALRPFARRSEAAEPTLTVDTECGPTVTTKKNRRKRARRAAVSGLIVGVLAAGALVRGADSRAKERTLVIPSEVKPLLVTGLAAQARGSGTPEASSAPKLHARETGHPSPPAHQLVDKAASQPKLYHPRPRPASEVQGTPPIGRVDPRNPYGG